MGIRQRRNKLRIWLNYNLSLYLQFTGSIRSNIYLDLSICLSLSVCLSIYLPVYLFAHISVYLSVSCLSIWISICLSIYLIIFLSLSFFQFPSEEEERPTKDLPTKIFQQKKFNPKIKVNSKSRFQAYLGMINHNLPPFVRQC